MAPRKKLTAVAKVAKSTKASKATICTAPTTTLAPAIPPARVHNASYHYPLLLEAEESCGALLSWFEGVEETRSMPWRKRWIDPKNFEGRETELSAVLGKRAYEVWVSEVSK
jgi:A/G-specific adenine glycosylase